MALDLNRIEVFTRELLEAEARRRHIRGPEYRTRAELIRLILRHQYGERISAGRDRFAKGMRGLQQARDFFTAAISAVPGPTATVQRLRSHLPLQRKPAPQSEPPSQPAPEPAVAPPEVVDHEASKPSATKQVAASAVEPTPQEPRGTPQARTRTFIEEPIRTHSMARLLAAQGYRERALAIYDELLALHADDPGLRREAERVRRGETIEAPELPVPIFGHSRMALSDSSDRLQCEGEPSAGLRLSWQVSEAGLLRARTLLGGPGELAIQLVQVRPDAEHVVRTEITEHGPVAPSDTWVAPPLPQGAHCVAAIGLREGARFVAIAHAMPARSNAAGSAMHA